MKVLPRNAEIESIAADFSELIRNCRSLIKNQSDYRLIRQAIKILIRNKGLEKTKTGDFAILHSIKVANIVVNEIGLGKTSVICALLFSLVEEKKISIDQISKEFGENAVVIVRGLVKVAGLYEKNAVIESENFRNLLLTFADDVRVIFIIVSDRLNTLRHIGNAKPEIRKAVSREISYLYAPLAHRLGLYAVKTEMEDLSMKYLNTEIYRYIAKKLNETKRSRDAYIADFISPLKTTLKEHDIKAEVKGRTKSIYSIWRKMEKQKVDFEQVYDLFAIRIIIDSPPEKEKTECWNVYSLITEKYQPNPKRLRDWLSIPKTNGYESLHTTLMGPGGKWVEVQIRSARMDLIAEKGLAAHWRYKGIKSDKNLDSLLTNIRELIENPEKSGVEYIEDFRLNLFEDEIFVFTPRGDLIKLAAESTIIDFAYHIHSRVGDQCVGAMVNNKNVSIKYALQNGDQVEILTSTNQTPKSDWLQIAVTGKARSKIKQSIRQVELKNAEIGRETLKRKFRNWKIEFKDDNINKVLQHYKLKTATDLYGAIAEEKIDMLDVRAVVTAVEEKQVKIPVQKQVHENIFEQITKSDEDVLIISENVKNVDYKLARCCNPIFGDAIFGFVTIGDGIKIHRKNCKNARQLVDRYPYRLIHTRWTMKSGKSTYETVLRISGSDNMDLLSAISDVISKDLKVQMRSVSVDTNEGIFMGSFTVMVNNLDHLKILIKKLQKIKGVNSVTRFTPGT